MNYITSSDQNLIRIREMNNFFESGYKKRKSLRVLQILFMPVLERKINIIFFLKQASSFSVCFRKQCLLCSCNGQSITDKNQKKIPLLKGILTRMLSKIYMYTTLNKFQNYITKHYFPKINYLN